MSNTALVTNPFQAIEASEPRSSGTEVSSVREAQEVQAMVAVAKRFPRDPVQAMDRILQACTRPGLAEESQYQYTQGGADVSGISIRLAEVMAQCWGNMDYGYKEVNRTKVNGVGVSDILTYAWDLETNTRKPIQFKVIHWRDTGSGGYPLKSERDIYNHIANQASRRVRNCILAIIPGDVADAARKQCDLTLSAHADTSPEAIKKLMEAFAQFGVTRAQIEARIQRRLDSITPALMIQMRKIYTSLRDGMSGVSDWFAAAGEPTAVATNLKDRLRGKQPEPPMESPAQEVAEALIQAVDNIDSTKPRTDFDSEVETPPAEYIALIEAIYNAPTLFVLKTLRPQLNQLSEPWQADARQTMTKRAAEFAKAN